MTVWHLSCAAVTGSSHLKRGVPCQDRAAVAQRDGISIIALSDGAGSATQSHQGAELLVSSAIDWIANNFDFSTTAPANEVLSHLFPFFNERLRQLAENLSCDEADLSATLLLVAVKHKKGIAFHVGDGVIGGIKNRELKVLSHPENGDFANTTTFVNTPGAIESARLLRFDASKWSGFVLMSDGPERCLYQKQTGVLARANIKLLFNTQKLESNRMDAELLETLERQISKKTSDDCSVALMARSRSKLNRLYRGLS